MGQAGESMKKKKKKKPEQLQKRLTCPISKYCYFKNGSTAHSEAEDLQTTGTKLSAVKITACLLLEKQSLLIRDKKILSPSIHSGVSSGQNLTYCSREEGSFGGTTFSDAPVCQFYCYSAFSWTCSTMAAPQWVPRGWAIWWDRQPGDGGALEPVTLLGQANARFVFLWFHLVRQLWLLIKPHVLSWNMNLHCNHLLISEAVRTLENGSSCLGRQTGCPSAKILCSLFPDNYKF